MSRVTDSDVIFCFRLQLFVLAERTSVAEACRLMGVHRSTFYRWKRRVERYGVEILRPRERRAPRMPNQLSQASERRIIAFALAHPGAGPDRIASELGRAKWGGLIVSPSGVWRVLRRHGLNTQLKRNALVAGYAAPFEPPREAPVEPHIEVARPGQLVGVDCFFVGNLRELAPVWQVTAIDCYSSYAWTSLVACPNGQPSTKQTSQLVKRVASDLASCGWRLERVLTDNGNEFSSNFDTTLAKLKTKHTRIRAGRPQTNGHVERLHRTILDEFWRPSFARYLYLTISGLRRDLNEYTRIYNTDRTHNGRITKGRIPIDIIDPARKMRPT